MNCIASLNDHDSSLDNIDIMSDTSSMATTLLSGISSRMSSSTTMSTRTSKLRRKLERKKAAGKGEAFEEDYLIESLKKLIEKSNQMRNEVHSLLEFLCICGQLSDASLLQKEFKSLLLKFETFYSEIFVSNSMEPTLEQLKNGMLNQNDPIETLSHLLGSKCTITPPQMSLNVWSLALLDSLE